MEVDSTTWCVEPHVVVYTENVVEAEEGFRRRRPGITYKETCSGNGNLLREMS